MAENKEKKQAMWLETDIEPVWEFENEDFKRLIQYANENQKNLMRLLYNEHSDELRLGCKFGNSKLHFFERAISEDEKLLTVFRLGALYGHIKCLDTIEYERMHDSDAVARIQMVTNQLPKLESETKEQELINVVKVKLSDLRLILHTLFINGLIYESDICGYSLNDRGLRAAKQLNKK